MSFDYGAELQIGGDNFHKWPQEGEKVALIDGDLIPYIVGHSTAPAIFDRAKRKVINGLHKDIRETEEFLDKVDQLNWIINSWVRGAGCDAAKIFLTDSKSNFRINVAFSKPYKGQRPSEKPPFFYELREYLLQKHDAILAVGNEADDLISIEMTKDAERLAKDGVVLGSPEHKVFAGCVCCTQDKDLRMISGWHYQPKTNYCESSVFFVDEIGWLEPVWKTKETKTKGTTEYIDKLKGAGLQFFYAQILMGDTADNYGGLKGCGKTRAYELVSRCKTQKEMYEAVLAEYKAKYPKGMLAHNYRGGAMHLTAYQLMLEQGRLAYMQRKEGDVWREKSHLPLGDDPAWNE